MSYGAGLRESWLSVGLPFLHSTRPCCYESVAGFGENNKRNERGLDVSCQVKRLPSVIAVASFLIYSFTALSSQSVWALSVSLYWLMWEWFNMFFALGKKSHHSIMGMVERSQKSKKFKTNIQWCYRHAWRLTFDLVYKTLFLGADISLCNIRAFLQLRLFN